MTDVYLLRRPGEEDHRSSGDELKEPRHAAGPERRRPTHRLLPRTDPAGQGGRDIYLYDRVDKKFLPLPGLNSPAAEQSPSLTADGRYLAFVSERLTGAGDRDIYLYDRTTQKLLPTPGLNHKEDDFDPSIIELK